MSFNIKKLTVFSYLASSLLTGVICESARATGRSFFAPPNVNYCFAPKNNWNPFEYLGDSFSPDCATFTPCGGVNVSPGEQPQACGETRFSRFSLASGDLDLNNLGQTVQLDLNSEELNQKTNCGVAPTASITCVSDQSLRGEAFYDAFVTLPNGERRIERQITTIPALLISAVTPTRWVTNVQEFGTGKIKPMQVVLELDAFPFPEQYNFKANVRWSSGADATVSFSNDTYFTHKATLVSSNAAKQVFKVTSSVSKAQSPTARAVAFSFVSKKLQIEDGDLAKLLKIAPQMRSSYNISVEVEEIQREAGSSSAEKANSLGVLYSGSVENPSNQSMINVDLTSMSIAPLKQDPKYGYRAIVTVKTTRTGNQFVSEAPSSTEAEFVEAKKAK